MNIAKQSLTFIVNLLGFALCGTLVAAHAQATYSYTGQPYNPLTHVCNGTYLPCTQLRVTGTITLPAELPANFSGFVTPVSFAFSDGMITLSSATALDVSTFQISTDSGGNIVVWNVVLETLATTDACATFNTELIGTYGNVSSGLGGDYSCYSSNLDTPEQEYGAGGNAVLGAWLTSPVIRNLAEVSGAINQLFQTIRNDPANAGLSEHQIAELAFTAIVDARQGFYGAGNQFDFLQDLDISTLAAVDHFAQAYAVSTNNTFFENPATGFILGAVIDPVYNIGKEITQSFGVDFLDAGNGPQSPANFDFWALAGADAAISEMPPGAVPDAGTDAVPIDPVSTDPDSSVFVTPVQSSDPDTFDPPRARNYHLQVLYGAAIRSVMIPRAALTFDRPKLSYGGRTVLLDPGVAYTFPMPISDFTLLDVTGPANATFLTTLGFASNGIEVVAQTAVSQLAPHLESNFDSVALDSSGANYVISFKTTNTGSETAEGVTITRIEVNGTPTLTALPIPVGTLISRATISINASVPIRSIEKVDDARVKVTFQYSGGTASSEFLVLRSRKPWPFVSVLNDFGYLGH